MIAPDIPRLIPAAVLLSWLKIPVGGTMTRWLLSYILLCLPGSVQYYFVDK